jgi:protein-S-isoprenylcysteine O-methyltransferase Ste14
MRGRPAFPLFLNAFLVTGMAFLSWRKLTTWQGWSLLLGTGVSIGYVAWSIWESRTSLKDSRTRCVRSDRWTLEFYALSQGATAISALVFKSQWPTDATVYLIGGASIFVGGVILRVSAVLELGQFYSHRVQVMDTHRIVQTGPYRWIRHPAYSGMLLAHLGLVLVYFNWLSLVLLLAALLPALVIRILVEERTLASIPGYVEFCAGRARILPRVW